MPTKTDPRVWPLMRELTKTLGHSYEELADPEQDPTRLEMLEVFKYCLECTEGIADLLEDSD